MLTRKQTEQVLGEVATVVPEPFASILNRGRDAISGPNASPVRPGSTPRSRGELVSYYEFLAELSAGLQLGEREHALGSAEPADAPRPGSADSWREATPERRSPRRRAATLRGAALVEHVLQCMQNQQDELRSALRVLDPSGTGKVLRSDFRKLCDHMIFRLSDQQFGDLSAQFGGGIRVQYGVLLEGATGAPAAQLAWQKFESRLTSKMRKDAAVLLSLLHSADRRRIGALDRRALQVALERWLGAAIQKKHFERLVKPLVHRQSSMQRTYLKQDKLVAYMGLFERYGPGAQAQPLRDTRADDDVAATVPYRASMRSAGSAGAIPKPLPSESYAPRPWWDDSKAEPASDPRTNLESRGAAGNTPEYLLEVSDVFAGGFGDSRTGTPSGAPEPPAPAVVMPDEPEPPRGAEDRAAWDPAEEQPPEGTGSPSGPLPGDAADDAPAAEDRCPSAYKWAGIVYSEREDLDPKKNGTMDAKRQQAKELSYKPKARKAWRQTAVGLTVGRKTIHDAAAVAAAAEKKTTERAELVARVTAGSAVYADGTTAVVVPPPPAEEASTVVAQVSALVKDRYDALLARFTEQDVIKSGFISRLVLLRHVQEICGVELSVVSFQKLLHTMDVQRDCDVKYAEFLLKFGGELPNAHVPTYVPPPKSALKRDTTVATAITPSWARIIAANWVPMKDTFRQRDWQCSGSLSPREFKQCMAQYDIKLSAEQLAAVAKRWAGAKDPKKVAYVDFLRHYMKGTHSKREAQKSLPKRANTAQRKTRTTMSPQCDEVLRLIEPTVTPQWVAMRRACLKHDKKPGPRKPRKGAIQAKQFKKVLRDAGVDISDDQIFHVYEHFDDGTSRGVRYDGFFKEVLRCSKA